MFLVILKGNNFVYNIGNDNPEINMTDLYQTIKKNVPKKVSSVNINYPKNYPQVEPQRRCPDISKIKKELNFKNRVSLKDSIKRFYNWSKIYY